MTAPDELDVDPLPWERDEQSFDAAEHAAADRHLADERAEADRFPYVGEGADGARRSAEIDREEADGLDRDDPRHAERLASAEEWDRQADRLDPAENLPAIFDLDGAEDFLAIRDAARISAGAKALRDELVEKVRAIIDEQLRTLPVEPPTSSTEIRPQATRLADLTDLLEAVAGAFTAAAKEAKGATGELVTALGHPIRVGDGYGSDLRVTLDQRKELSVDHDAVDDVLVAAADVEDHPLAETYLRGVRTGIEALRAVLGSSPTYRSTALDALVGDLEDRDLDELAKRLRKAYGKVAKGEPSVKIERLEPKAPRA